MRPPRSVFRTLTTLNASKPVRKEGMQPRVCEWAPAEQDILCRICGDVMDELGCGGRAEGSYGELWHDGRR